MLSTMEKPRTREQLEQELENMLRKFRVDTHFAKKIPKWSKGRLFCLHNEEIFTFSTNNPSIHHLNLEETAFPCDSLSVSELFPEDKFRHFPFLLDTSILKNNSSELDVASQDIVARHRDKARKVINFEKEVMGLISLLDIWDEEKFMKLLDYHLDDVFNFPIMPYMSVTTRFYVEIVMVSYAKSLFIVEFMKKASTYCTERNWKFLACLPDEHIKFFDWHLKRMPTEYFESVIQEEWFRNDDILLLGLKWQDTDLLNISLELEWPSELMSFIFPQESTEIPEVWPRLKKDGVPARSFNSIEYYKVLTRGLVTGLELPSKLIGNGGIEDDEKQEAISFVRKFWRAIPTPYIPIGDMRQYSEHCRLTGEHHLWTLLAEVAEEDPPDVHKPKSLQHLSRCGIRRKYRSPEQIARLPLPKILQRYVNLEY